MRDKKTSTETTDQNKKNLLTHIRHSLRSPMNDIIGYSEMLLDDAVELGQEDFISDLENIYKAGNRLLDLVNDLLDPAKTEAGALDLEPEAFVATVRHKLRTPLNAIVGYSEMLLEDAGKNLGGKGFIPDLKNIQRAGKSMLTLIDAVDLDKLSLQKAYPTPTLIADTDSSPRPPDDEGDLKVAYGDLLVVDDNEMNRDLLARRLERLGYTIYLAEDGGRALEMIKEHEFDLILLDIMMPELNGYQVLEGLKADDATRHIPVIMISALDEIEGVARCIEMGAEDYLTKPFNPVLLKARIGASLEKKRLRDHEVSRHKQVEADKKRSDYLLNVIIPIGLALSAEKNHDRLLENILRESMSICNADGGTLYLRTEDDHLQFAIMYTTTLNIALGGTTGKEIPLPPMSLYDEETGAPNHGNVATHAALSGFTVNIPDAYHADGFDFSGTKIFDKQNGYRSTSFLTLPLKNHLNKVIGVLQLINAQEKEGGEIIPFGADLQQVIESLASLAAVALENHNQQTMLKDTLKEIQQIAVATERFVPREFLSFLGKQSVVDIKLGDQVEREMTVLFSDMRAFTKLSERMIPEESFRLLNSYLGQMEPAIMAHHGFIDKYIGDGIMALYPTGADDAIRGSIAMLGRLADYNRGRQKAGYQPIQIGIGLHTGRLILGTIGGQNRMDGTVISDAVNLASRIEGMTKIYGASLLISEGTYSRLQDTSQYAIRVVDRVQVKGKTEATTVYEVFDGDPSPIIGIKRKTLDDFNGGLDLYRRKKFTEAGKLFAKVLQTNEDDIAASLYLKRCEHFGEHGVPKEWEGIIVLEEK